MGGRCPPKHPQFSPELRNFYTVCRLPKQLKRRRKARRDPSVWTLVQILDCVLDLLDPVLWIRMGAEEFGRLLALP